MNFKIHLIIISAIILALYTALQFRPEPTAENPIIMATQDNGDFAISVAGATWRGNCPPLDPEKTSNRNNVLTRVVELCNGKSECNIPLNVATLGYVTEDSCPDRMLEVEYRCFSYDKLWNASSYVKSLTINCKRERTNQG